MSLFNQLVSNVLSSKSADDLLKGENSKYLDVGEHDVKITGVDSSKVGEAKPYVVITYMNAEGKDIKDYVFLNNFDKNDLSKEFKSLYCAAFTCQDLEKTKTAVIKFLSEAAKNNEAPNILTGMSVRIKVGMENKGYLIKSTGENQYVAIDVKTDEVLGGPCETYKEAKELMKEKGLYPSKRKVIERSAIDGERNIQILDTALPTKSGASGASSDPSKPKFV